MNSLRNTNKVTYRKKTYGLSCWICCIWITYSYLQLEYLLHNLRIRTSHNSVATFRNCQGLWQIAVLRESSSEHADVLLFVNLFWAYVKLWSMKTLSNSIQSLKTFWPKPSLFIFYLSVFPIFLLHDLDILQKLCPLANEHWW